MTKLATHSWNSYDVRVVILKKLAKKDLRYLITEKGLPTVYILLFFSERTIRTRKTNRACDIATRELTIDKRSNRRPNKCTLTARGLQL